MRYAFIVNPASGKGKHGDGIVTEIEELIKNGGFQQAIHVMAWLLAKEKDA